MSGKKPQKKNQGPPKVNQALQKQARPAPARVRSTSTNSGGDAEKDVCIVCYRAYTETKYHSIGPCDHRVCFECSVRMRVLLEQNECPSCRQAQKTVVITHGIKPYKELQTHLRMYTLIPQYGIYLEDEEIKNAFDELLEHRCFLCDGLNLVFKTFNGLKSHVAREHSLYTCDLCVENIKHFSKERKFYSRADLAYHKRKGDRNDTSHRGHPNCQFCDVRYFDDDVLYRHLRREHYFCHFCDADGHNHYYNMYDDLRMHFRKEHFLCEEEQCVDEKFTSVFRTDIDLKAHLTTAHSRLLGRHGTKQVRHLDVEFSMRPSDEERRGRFGRPDHRRARDRDRDREEHQEEPPPSAEYELSLQKPKFDSPQDFPTLGADPAAVAAYIPPEAPGPQSSVRPQQPTISSRIAPTWNAKTKLEDDFPLLGGMTESVNRMSIKPKPFMSNSAAQAYQKPRPQTPQEDFPALPKQNKPSWSGVSSGGAVANSNKNQNAKGMSKKAAPAPVLPKPEFNFIPLYKDKSNVQNGRPVHISPPASPEPMVRVIPVTDPEAASKKKKKSIAQAAAAIFNGGNLPSRMNGNPNEPKLPRRPQNTEEDFPSLQPIEGSKKIIPKPRPIPKPKPQPPPRKISPPPGFSLITSVRNNGNNPTPRNNKPPPGFEVIVPKTIGMYSQPADYPQRLDRLLEGIKMSLKWDAASVEIFNSFSSQFKKGEISAKEYYEMCQDMLGKMDFGVMFPEIISLLTDVKLQQDLLRIHHQAGGAMNILSVCHECGQVLKLSDVTSHMKTHSGGDPFPSLSDEF